MSITSYLLLPFLGAKKRLHRRRAYTSHAPGEAPNNAFKLELQRSETHHEDFSQKAEEDIVRDYNAPVHMWVVATLFPLIAGTFGPMASMFNICAIAISWRVIVDPSSKESGGHKIPDDHAFVAVNIVSLIIAIIANVSLLGQMTNRIRYNISGPITIVGFYISGFFDVALVAAAPSQMPLPDNPQATWSQAFYYAAFSGAIYVLLAIMLTVTACGIWIGHYSEEFKLSLSQRSLMLQTILFLGYVLCVGAVYSRIENWDFLNATYFAVVTLFTIGFGDFVPTTHLGRSLFFPMAVGGILFVGVIIANIRTLVLESGSVKVSTRMVEKARTSTIKSGNPEDGTVKLRGVKTRDTNGATEIERRKKEFLIMREIQKQAAQNNRIFALAFALTAFSILWFIGAVVFWQAEQSTGGQNWTYFETVYFTFVAQVTIGYGDFEPQTNSSKPAFVFWALIALPTLTVLIGAVGDIVADFVNWYTDWIGRHSQDIWKIWQAVRGKTKENPMDAAKKLEKEQEEAEKNFGELADIENRVIIPRELDLENLSEEQIGFAEHSYRPLMMLRAANKIVGHLDDDPPKQYNYEEWAWLLKLIGEHEENEEGHRRVGQMLPDGAQVLSPLREHKRQVWSWMGQESPLMSLEDDVEPKWILRRLMRVLEQDLLERAERHVRREIGVGLQQKKTIEG